MKLTTKLSMFLVLALMLVAGTAITYALSRRMRLNQAVQLGSRM